MSYRTIKRVLGETSLERKCRFLFGGGLMLLISGAFFLYGRLNTNLIAEHDVERARLLVAPRLLLEHWSDEQLRLSGDDSGAREFANLLSGDGIGQTPVPKNNSTSDDDNPAGESVPNVDEDAAPYEWFLYSASLTDDNALRRPDDRESGLAHAEIVNGSAEEVVYVNAETGAYNYFGAIRASESCVGCHRQESGDPDLNVGDLLGVARITFPVAESERTIAKNNALLLLMAVLTAFAATLSAYAMIRYVIVKPLLHLREVSDAVTQGDLDQRADIQTNDDFEDLSRAFNRMLRHLVQMQEDQKKLNVELDKNVEQLARANLGLYEANRLKNEFLATVTHELRTPLNSILGFSDILRTSQNLSERESKYAGNIDRSGRNLLSLINDILDIAKIEAGKMGRESKPFELVDLVEREASSIEPLAERKNISLTTHIPEDMPTLHQDEKKLRQILINLMSNAVKFTPEGGRVSVRARPENEAVVIDVEDSGIGIPLDEQAHIFEKFRQAKSQVGDELTREYEGTGLGLSIVKELCRLLDGEVTLVSEFGKGSTFTIRLPTVVEPVDEFEIADPTVKFDDDSAVNDVETGVAEADATAPSGSPE